MQPAFEASRLESLRFGRFHFWVSPSADPPTPRETRGSRFEPYQRYHRWDRRLSEARLATRLADGEKAPPSMSPNRKCFEVEMVGNSPITGKFTRSGSTSQCMVVLHHNPRYWYCTPLSARIRFTDIRFSLQTESSDILHWSLIGT